MFRFLKRHRGRDRKLFAYDDGTRRRYADPLTVMQRLALHPKFRFDHIGGALAGDPLAQRIVAAAACDAFDVQPFNDATHEGLTQTERIDLVIAFDLYMQALKKNTSPTPTPRRSTASTSTESSGPITKDSSHLSPTGSDH